MERQRTSLARKVGLCPFDHRAWLSVSAVLATASQWMRQKAPKDSVFVSACRGSGLLRPDSSRARAKSIGHYILGGALACMDRVSAAALRLV